MEKAGLAGAMRPVVPECGRTRTAKPRVRVAGAQAARLTTAALPALSRITASAPARAYTACALHPMVTVCMPMHAPIIRGRRHLRVALEISGVFLAMADSAIGAGWGVLLWNIIVFLAVYRMSCHQEP